MSTNSCLLSVGSIEALVIRKPIKNVHLCVLPPLGKVRVTAPINMKDDAIRTLIATKIPWIKKNRIKFESQSRQTAREYVSGESHFFLGARYRLTLLSEDRPPMVEIKGKSKIILHVRPRSSLAKREEVMKEWYRAELKKITERLISKWEKRIGVQTHSWGVKRMKTRWGTCNQESKSIWLNLELAKKPPNCIEYVIVHELVHLLERKHNERFVQLMNKYLPKWRSRKEELNQFILSHEEWSYLSH